MKNTCHYCISSFYVFLLSCIICITCQELKDCINRTPPRCCRDYYEDGSLCKPCIGSYGNNCSSGVCSPGYFGHGCNEKCPCGTVLCDPEHGCPKDYGYQVHHYWLFIILGVLVINSVPVVIAISGCITNRNSSETCKNVDTLQNIKIRGDNVFNRIKWPSVSLNFFSKCWKRPPPDTSDVKDVEQGQRWRTKERDTEISNENVPSGMKWPTGLTIGFLRCWKSSPSGDSAVENVKQDLRWRNTDHKNAIRQENVFHRIKWPNVSLNGLFKCLKRSSDHSDVEDVEQDLSRLESPSRGGVLNLYVDTQNKHVKREQLQNDVDNTTDTSKEDYFVMRMSTAPPKETVHHFTGREEEDDEDDDIDDDKEVVYVEMNLQ